MAAALGAMTQAAPPPPVRRRVTQRLAYPRRADGATRVTERWAPPVFAVAPEPAPTETLVQALDAAYRTTPALQAQRYTLRAADEDYALALSETRATLETQLTGGYTRTDPGDRTNATRSPADRLASRDVVDNSLAAQVILNQPLLTGGRAAADRAVASHTITAGRAALRGVEGDTFLQVVTAYADIRRDTRVLALREANLKQLAATLEEVRARQDFTATGTSHDYIQVDKSLFADWSHLLGATKQVGADLVITYDASNTITLKSVALSSFTSADAIFV